MALRIATVTVLVDDYDRALAFYCGVLGLERIEDRPLDAGKRWVVVGGTGGARLLLALASGERQAAAIGNQTGGRVGFFLETDDFARDHARLVAVGVRFLEAPRREPYGTVAVFADLYDNKWDLIEPKPA